MLQNNCKNCSNDFEITEDDLKFYDKISPVINGSKLKVPPPILCYDCRQQRRLAFRNDRKLYKRNCDLCNKSMVSIYTKDAKMPVYCTKCWWSDKWDPTDYGREFDFDRPFFDQFRDLRNEVPVCNLLHKNIENSEYTHLETDTKNCYMTIGGHFNEDCMYTMYQFHGTDCMDNYWSDNCELCYECFKCFNVNRVLFSFWCFNCNDCKFCYDCKSCNYCFGCVGLRQKKYCFFNEQLSKEEYEKRMKEIVLTPNNIKLFEEEVKKIWDMMPHPNLIMENCENCLGTYLNNCKNCKYCFEVDDSEDCKYCEVALKIKDCYDGTRIGFESELCYENMAGTFLKQTMFSNFSFDHHYFCFYIDNCFSTKYLFGCTNMHHKRYCILNKQYSQKQWEALVPKIVKQMTKNGEWGEYFPIKLSPFAYNETAVIDYFPLTKEEALANGYKWMDPDSEHHKKQTCTVPVNIKDVQDTIVYEIIACEDCGRNYKIINKELSFYRKLELPIPLKCSDCRHKKRMRFKNARHFWNRSCKKCGADIQSTYSPERPEKVYCEQCYLKEFV